MSASRKVRFFLTGLLAMLGLSSCEAFRDYPKNIREFPEPWQVLEPGTRRQWFPVPRVISEGSGAPIAPGDLVQLHIRNKWVDDGTWHDRGNWWIWIGFTRRDEASFFANEPRIASALVGFHEGTALEFVDAKDEPGIDSRYAGTLNLNVFGDADYYTWKKNARESVNIYVSTSRTPTTVEIKRVCKGQARYRTVRLFDDSPVQICSGVKCRVSTEIREAWIDEAQIDSVCQDGKRVNFKYGPIDSRSGRAGRSPKRGYFDEWLHAAWSKIPEGVQFEGNRAPEVKTSRMTTKPGIPVKIDFLANASDADGDKLTMRIDSVPRHGKLTANPDGSMTYTPEAGWLGVEHVSYRVSDGMAEKGGQVDLEVVR